MTYTTLISAAQLARLTQDQPAPPVVIFDCSFELSQPTAGHQAFLASHISNAIYANLDTVLSSHGANAASGGRHPLPTREAFAAWAASVGMTQDAQAVVYDRNGSNYCGRLWWMFKWIGHNNVAVLDGGFQAWEAFGGTVMSGSQLQELGAFPAARMPVRPSAYQLVTADQVAAAVGRSTQTLIDARAAVRFRGEVEPLDSAAGHIPGALNRPFLANMGNDGLFKPAALLKSEFEALLAGREPATVVHHCGSGVSALPNLLAMEIAGLGTTALYAGSWSDWCSQPDRPAAKG